MNYLLIINVIGFVILVIFFISSSIRFLLSTKIYYCIVIILLVIVLLCSLVMLKRNNKSNKINEQNTIEELLEIDIANFYIKDKEIIFGKEVVDMIKRFKECEIQFEVITKARKETGKKIYNWNCVNKKSIKTYENVSKGEDEYINPNASFRTSVKTDEREKIIVVTYEQQ